MLKAMNVAHLKSMMSKLYRFSGTLEWINVFFLTLTPLFAAAGVIFLVQFNAVRWPTVLFALVYGAMTGLAVTAGYHRLFAHRSYEASWPVRFAMLLLGAASFENSVLLWASDHRNHHKYVDTDLDPYNIKRGFWYAHIGWIFFKRETSDCSNVTDLNKDPLVRFQHRHYLSIAVLMGFGLPMAVAALWGDLLGGLILAGLVRVVLNHHFTFSINSFCHFLGGQPYSDRNSSRDSWIPALFTYGEGYHNFHHTFPSDYRNAIRAYQWDPTKWLIHALQWVGQTRRLHSIDSKRILAVRLKMDEKKLLQKVERAPTHPLTRDRITAARAKCEESYACFQANRAAYVKAKAGQWEDFAKAQRASLQEHVDSLRQNMRKTKQEFDSARTSWKRLCTANENFPPLENC